MSKADVLLVIGGFCALIALGLVGAIVAHDVVGVLGWIGRLL